MTDIDDVNSQRPSAPAATQEQSPRRPAGPVGSADGIRLPQAIPQADGSPAQGERRPAAFAAREEGTQ